MTKTILILCPHIRFHYSGLGKGAFQYARALITQSLYSSQSIYNKPLDFYNRRMADGRGEQKFLRDAIERENMQKRVFVLGSVSEGGKAWLMQHCHGFVFPSL